MDDDVATPALRKMTRKRRRLWIVLACGVGLGSATALVLLAFNDNLVFFVSPSDLANAAGSVFKGGEWTLVGYRMSDRVSRHRNRVGIWRLTNG